MSTLGQRRIRTAEIQFGNDRQRIRLRGDAALLLSQMKQERAVIQFDPSSGRFMTAAHGGAPVTVDGRLMDSLAGARLVVRVNGAEPPAYRLGERAEKYLGLPVTDPML